MPTSLLTQVLKKLGLARISEVYEQLDELQAVAQRIQQERDALLAQITRARTLLETRFRAAYATAAPRAVADLLTRVQRQHDEIWCAHIVGEEGQYLPQQGRVKEHAQPGAWLHIGEQGVMLYVSEQALQNAAFFQQELTEAERHKVRTQRAPLLILPPTGQAGFPVPLTEEIATLCGVLFNQPLQARNGLLDTENWPARPGNVLFMQPHYPGSWAPTVHSIRQGPSNRWPSEQPTGFTIAGIFSEDYAARRLLPIPRP